MLDRRLDRSDSAVPAWGTRASSRPGPGHNCGWVLLSPAAGGRDALVMDEWGTLWWAQVAGDLAAFIRICSLDEAEQITAALDPARRSILRLA